MGRPGVAPLQRVGECGRFRELTCGWRPFSGRACGLNGLQYALPWLRDQRFFGLGGDGGIGTFTDGCCGGSAISAFVLCSEMEPSRVFRMIVAPRPCSSLSLKCKSAG